MTLANPLSILAGSVACPSDDKPQPTGAERETRNLFVKIAYCLIISRFRIEDYMSTFQIVPTSLPPIYVGVYPSFSISVNKLPTPTTPDKSFYGVE
jgi:hypothetical protein